MSQHRSYRKIVSLILVFVLILMPVLEVKADNFKTGENLSGLGRVTESFSREIQPGLVWSQLRSKNGAGRQFSQIFEFDEGKSNFSPKVTVGSYVYGNETVKSMVRRYEKAGYTVVFAVNGDSFKNNGVPKGAVITDGILVTTPETSTLTLGYAKDKGYVYGYPGISIYAKTSEGTAAIRQLNKERMSDTSGTYLLTGQFLNRSRSSKEGVEVLVDVTTSSYRGLKIGQEFQGKVREVYQVGNRASGNTTPLGKNQWIISCHKEAVNYNMLSKLVKGSPITISVSSNARDVDWSSVDQAIGVFRPLKMSGVETSRVSEKGYHPRTCFFFSKDGRVMIMENDGRRSSARGLSYRQMVDFGNKTGFENILGFDGGGSSTVFITMPGFSSAVKVNQPSDGWDRSVGNCMLFVKPRKKGTSLTKLHVYPEKGYEGEVTLGIGESCNLVVKGTDDNFDPVDVNSKKVSFSSDLGKHIAGKFVAGPNLGTSIIEATYPGGAKGTIKLNVVNNSHAIKSLAYDGEGIFLAPGKSEQINIMGKTSSSSKKIDKEFLTYELSDPSLGTIDGNGLFKAAAKEAKGNLIVKYGKMSLNIPVTIKEKKPVERIAGDTRFGTAKKIAEKMSTSNTALIASSENYPDALVSALLAHEKKAAILLSSAKKLSRETLSALSNKGIKNVILLGGEKAISSSVANELKAKGYNVDRIGGNDRYETAVKISEKLSSSETFYMASGLNYPDALSMTALSISENRPLLLTSPKELSESTKARLVQAGAKNVVIAGGYSAISKKVENELKDMGISVSRLAGSDRYSTSSMISKKLVQKGYGLLLTRGDNYIDAVTAGPLAGASKRAILLVETKKVPSSCTKLIREVEAANVSIIGGFNAISRAVEDAVGMLVK